MAERETGIRRIVFGLFLVVIFSLGLMKPSLDIGFASLTPTDVLFPLAFLAWLFAIATAYSRFEWRVEYWIFALYFLALLISASFSVNTRLSFAKLAGVVYLVLLAVMTSSLVTTSERLRLLILTWIAGSGLAIIAGFIGMILFFLTPESALVAELIYHSGAAPIGNLPRLNATLISPSMFCNYLTVTLVLALVSSKMRWIGKRLALVLIAAIALSAILTVSIALGGFILAGGLWVWLASSNKSVGRLALLVAIAGGVAFLLVAPIDIQTGTLSAQPSSRLLIWREALATFLADPLTGRGLGTAVASVAFQNSDGSWSLLTDAHNSFLSLAAQAGVPGLIAIVALIIVLWKAATSRINEGDDRCVRYGLAIAFVTAFVYDGLTGSFEDARHLWVLMGLILASATMSSNDERSMSLDGA